MSNEFVYIPLNRDNFENVTSIPTVIYQDSRGENKIQETAEPITIKRDFGMPPEIINNLGKMCKIITDGTEKSILQAIKNIITSLNITIPPDFLHYFDALPPSFTNKKYNFNEMIENGYKDSKENKNYLDEIFDIKK